MPEDYQAILNDLGVDTSNQSPTTNQPQTQLQIPTVKLKEILLLMQVLKTEVHKLQRILILNALMKHSQHYV